MASCSTSCSSAGSRSIRTSFAPAGYDEIRRVIRESDPPKPSVRVEQRSDRIGTAARARQTDAPGLTRQLRGDLDWITLKALEKDRKRRYATVAAFATDIGRFLDDQPVDARPPSSTYRIRKFTRRHRGAVAAAVSLFVVLVAGLAASRSQYLRAEDARIEANRQRTEAESERARADSARAAAEAATAEANIQRLDAERQRLMATQETQRAVAALDLADYRNYVITIAAADAEVQASRFSEHGSGCSRSLRPGAAGSGTIYSCARRKRLLTLADRAPCPSAQPAGVGAYIRHSGQGSRWEANLLQVLPTCEQLEHGNPGALGGIAHPKSSLPRLHPPEESRCVTTSRTYDVAVRQRKWNLYVVDSIGVQLPKLVGTFDRVPGCADLSRDGRMLALGLRPLITASSTNDPSKPPLLRAMSSKCGMWRTAGAFRR